MDADIVVHMKNTKNENSYKLINLLQQKSTCDQSNANNLSLQLKTNPKIMYLTFKVVPA